MYRYTKEEFLKGFPNQEQMDNKTRSIIWQMLSAKTGKEYTHIDDLDKLKKLADSFGLRY